MKKIYIILWEFKKSNGACRAVANLANMLVELYDVTIICTDTTTGESYYPLHKDIKTIFLGITSAKNLLDKFRRKKMLKSKLEKTIEKGSIAIGTNTTFNIVLSKIKNINSLGCEHINYETLPLLYRVLRRYYYKKLKKVVLLTEIDRKKYHFLDNSIVIPNSHSFLPTKLNDYSKKNIIAIGRLTYQKGFDILIDVCNIIKTSIPDWTISIVGDGEEKQKLLDKIASLHLNDFIKIISSQNNVIELYHSASIYVMSSRFEGLPMVLIEAQSCGLPIVSFDCPEGPSEIIHNNIDGFLVENNNISELANKIIELANNIDLRIKFGENAFKSSNRFSTDTIRKKWLDLLEEM